MQNNNYPVPGTPIMPAAPFVTAAPVSPEDQVKMLKRSYRREAGRVGGTLLVSQVLMYVFTIFVMLVPYMFFSISEEMIGIFGADTPEFLMVINRLTTPFSDLESNTVLLLSTIAASLFGLSIPALVYANKRQIDVFGLFRGGKFSLGFLLGASCLGLTLNVAWGYLYAVLCEYFPILNFNTEESALDFPTDSVLSIVLYIIAVCVVAPIFEELMFRGVLLKYLCRYGTTFAIFVTSLFFGLYHGNLAQTPATFLLALVMGYAAVKTGSVTCSVLIHMINNAVATLLSALYTFFPDAQWLTYADIGFTIVLLIGAVIFLISRPGRLPAESRKPSVPTVRHRYYHFLTSFLNLVFILLFVGMIILFLDFEAVGISGI